MYVFAGFVNKHNFNEFLSPKFWAHDAKIR